MSDIAKVFGDRIRNLRNERDWNQEELAHRANIHQTYVGQIERGEKSPTIETIEKIAYALETSMENLFKYIEPSSESKDNSTLSLIMNKLSTLKVEDQKNILSLLDVIFVWIKDK